MAGSKSPLLSLPPELRNRIWSLVLDHGDTQPRLHYARRVVPAEPQLLQVDKQTRTDAIAMWIASTSFIFFGFYSTTDLEPYYDWLDRLGESAVQYLQRFRFRPIIGGQVIACRVDLSAKKWTDLVRWTFWPQGSLQRAHAEELMFVISRARASGVSGRLGVGGWRDLLKALQDVMVKYQELEKAAESADDDVDSEDEVRSDEGDGDEITGDEEEAGEDEGLDEEIEDSEDEVGGPALDGD